MRFASVRRSVRASTRAALTLALTCSASLLAIAGCESSVPTFPPVGFDAGLECGEFDGGDLGSCGSGEVCLQGRCYAECSASRPCGPREECSGEGVCVPRTSDAGGPVDSGPPDPCDTVTCMDPTPFCRNAVCLGCESRDQCGVGGSPPICDLARGTCVAFRPELCAPCNVDADCNGDPPPDPALRCLTRGAGEPAERVCVPPCAAGGACPMGLECDTGTMLCVPKFNFSCTGLRAALDGQACATDDGCAPLGATVFDGLFTGSCFDGGSGTPTCHVPCGTDGDCPTGSCNGSYCI